MVTSKKKSALGGGLADSGLNALFAEQGVDTTVATNDSVREIELTKIIANPYQPRRVFDENALRELANSIKENGVLQPIIVRHTEDDASRYEGLAPSKVDWYQPSSAPLPANSVVAVYWRPPNEPSLNV